MILYSASLSMFGAKVQIALIEKAIDYQLVMVPYDRDRGYEPRHPEVVRVNPKRQVPILIDGDVELFDSTQIFEYLEDVRPAPPLWPREPAARAAARQLEMKSDEVYFPHVVRLMGLQERPDDPAAVAARDAAARYYVEMEATPGRARMARRRLHLRRHCVLHGGVVRRTHGRGAGTGNTETAGVA